jgi:hypothetical protein
MTISDKTREQWRFQPRPPGEKVKSRLEVFEYVNAFVNARHGWITSLPGAADITIECLPGSTLPDELRSGGAKVKIGEGRNERSMILPPYVLKEAGEGQRILAAAITEHVLIEGSTAVRSVTHAGIAKVRRFTFTI